MRLSGAESLVLIGGFPRSGTRQFCDILNAHQEVSIQGEMHRPVFKELVTLFEVAARCHQGKWSERGFERRRRSAILDIYGVMGKSGPQSGGEQARIRGFKQPYLETYSQLVKRLLREDYESCTFFFCIRNLKDNFLSLNSAFEYSLEKYCKLSMDSLQALEVISEDPFFNVRILSLDSFIASRDKAIWIEKNIFTPVNLAVTSQWSSNALEHVSNRNQTPPAKRRKDMSSAEHLHLSRHTKLRDAALAFQHRYDVNLLRELDSYTQSTSSKSPKAIQNAKPAQ